MLKDRAVTKPRGSKIRLNIPEREREREREREGERERGEREIVSTERAE